MSPSALKILDFVLLQAGWFACVLGAAWGHVWSGPLVVVAALALHLKLTPDPWRDLKIMAFMLLVGLAGDGLQVATGVLAFPDVPRLGVTPYWILALWPLFGSVFHTTLGWLKSRPWLAAVLGALGGPPGYIAADRLGALSLPRPLWVSFLALALTWSLALPLGLAVARRTEGEVAVA